MVDLRKGGVVIACAWLLQLPVAMSHPAAFKLEQIMEVPYPSSLVASASGGAAAWVFDTRGCRNIWLADAGSGMKGRKITPYTLDDGFDIGELAWAPDARSIAFTRGPDLEHEAPANVNNSPDGALPREVWMVPVSGGAPRKVGVGHSASFSPDGSRLLFINKEQILTVAAPGAQSAGDAQPLIVDNGRPSSLTWSRDGKRLAFLSARGSHTLVGVYDFTAKTLTWMSPSLDLDSSPVFAPDGTRIAFIREPWNKTPVFVSRRTGQPWSIWVADVKSGVGHAVWTADKGAGSVFHDTLAEQNLFWTARDHLLFPWEKTGWLQLYSVPVQGGSPRALTSGKFEVVHMVLSRDRQRLVYSSNEDTDRIHVWTVDPDNGNPAQAAPDRAIQDYPDISGDGTIFALRSDGNQPLQPVVLTQGGHWQPLAPGSIPESFPTSKLVMPTVVTFAAKDGQEVHAQLFVPRDAKPHPAIMFFHGGPRRQMLLGFNPMGAYNWMYAMNQYLVSEGYIVISVNYRGGIGYGRDYREATSFGPDGGSEINDLLGTVTYLKSRQDVDPHRIGIWGASYGGLMTALGLARASDDIAAGVDYAGVYNWATMLSGIGAPVEGDDATRKAVQSSPLATIDQWHSPVLIVQADDDRNVPSQQATELIEALRTHQIEHDEVMLPNEVHDLARFGSWMTLFNLTDRYFEQHLEQRVVTSR